MQNQNNNLSKCIDKILETLEKEKFSKNTIMLRKRHFIRIVKYLNSNNLSFSQTGVSLFLKEINGCGLSPRSIRGINKSCEMLNNFIHYGDVHYRNTAYNMPILSHNHQEVMNVYLNSIKDENSFYTINRKSRVIHTFLSYLENLKIYSFNDINIAMLIKFLALLETPEKVSCFKQFLFFLFQKRYVDCDFSNLLHQRKRPKKIPTTFTENEIRMLLNEVDTATPLGKRDLATLMIAAKLGLRTCDIVNLKFTNVNLIRKKLVIIQQKTSVELSLPISEDLVNAITNYINNARPKVESEYIFLKVNAPYKKINGRSLRYSLDKYLKKANVNLNNKKKGMHTLRASLATAMINNGASYDLVKQTLGHSSEYAITSYVKVDIENLRKFSLEAIKATNVFKDWLGDDYVD